MQPGTVSRDAAAACWLTGDRCRSCRLTLEATPEASECSFRITRSTATPSSAIAIAVQQLSAWLRCLATCALPRSSRPLWRTFCSPAALPSHCGLKELLRVERRAPLSPPWLSTSASCSPGRAKCAQLLSCGLRNRFGALSPFNPRPSRLGIRFPRRTDSTPINSAVPEAATVQDPASL